VTKAYGYDATIGTSGAVDYTPQGVTQHTAGTHGQVLRVWHNGLWDAASAISSGSTNNSLYALINKHPVMINVSFSGWNTSTLADDFDGSGTSVQRMIYQLLMRNWVVVDVSLTEGGCGETGDGAAHLPGESEYQDVTRPAWNTDVIYAAQWVQENIGTYGGDRDRVYICGGSAGAHASAWAALRQYVAGEIGTTASGGSNVDRGYDPSIKGGFLFECPWLWNVWPADKGVVGQVAASSADADAPGTDKQSISSAYHRGFSPHYWQNRKIPMFMAYTDDPSNDTYPVQPPFEIGTETQNHPVVMGEIAKVANSGLDPVSGLPWVTSVATTTDGSEPGFGREEYTERIWDQNNNLDTPLLRKMVAWIEKLDRSVALSQDKWYIDNPETRVIYSLASLHWSCAAPENPNRVGPVRLAAVDLAGEQTRSVRADGTASAAATSMTVDDGAGSPDNPVPEIRVGAVFHLGNPAAVKYTVTSVTSNAADTTIGFEPPLATAVADNDYVFFSDPRHIEVLLTQSTMPDPAGDATTAGKYVPVQQVYDDPTGETRWYEFDTKGAVWVRSNHSINEIIQIENGG